MEENKKEENSPSGKQMTEAEFASARERYELGSDTLIDLANEYKVSRQALSGRFKRNGVVRGSRAHEIASATSANAKAAAAAAAIAAERFSARRSEWIEDVRVNGVKALKQGRFIAQKLVIDEMKSHTPSLSKLEEDMKVLLKYNKILIDNIDASLRVLNADDHTDEDDLPTLVVEDLTEEDILNHHISTGVMPEGATVEDMANHELDFEGDD